MSFVLLAPVTVFMEGVKFTPTYMEAAVSALSSATPLFELLDPTG